jgi:hypothetical protein
MVAKDHILSLGSLLGFPPWDGLGAFGRRRTLLLCTFDMACHTPVLDNVDLPGSSGSSLTTGQDAGT